MLVVDSDPDVAALTTHALQTHGLTVRLVQDTAEMDRFMTWRRPDLIVLDLGQPREDRLSACFRLRCGGPPVILVSARGDEISRIVGLDMGAADYLPKPFNPRELVARIRAVLRRASHSDAPAPVQRWHFAGWTLDAATRRLTSSTGATAPLTATDFDILMVFCSHPGQTLSRSHLQELVKGPDSAAQERSVDLAVRRLRVKIEPNPSNPIIIQTVRSSGYIFSAPLQPVV